MLSLYPWWSFSIGLALLLLADLFHFFVIKPLSFESPFSPLAWWHPGNSQEVLFLLKKGGRKSQPSSPSLLLVWRSLGSRLLIGNETEALFPGLGSATVGIGPAGRKANPSAEKEGFSTYWKTVEALKCSHVSTPLSINYWNRIDFFCSRCVRWDAASASPLDICSLAEGPDSTRRWNNYRLFYISPLSGSSRVIGEGPDSLFFNLFYTC